MPTQQEEKLQNEFMHFWDNLKKTVNIGDYSDEITNWWIKKISLAVAQREKEMVEMFEQIFINKDIINLISKNK